MPNNETPPDRDALGRLVREAWIRWAKTQPSPKQSWLVAYDQLQEHDKEADRQIGEAVASQCSAPASRDTLDALERDAARWRALMASQRFHFLGSSGFEFDKLDAAGGRKFANLRPRLKAERLHLGLELWNIHPAHANTAFSDRFERDLLTLYVDTIIARSPEPSV